MKEVKDLERQVLKGLFIVDLILCVIIFLFFSEPRPVILGVIFGSLISGLNFLQMANSLIKAAEMQFGNAQGYTTRQYFIRYIVSAIVIYISVVAPYIDVMGTLLGLIIIKGVIYFLNFFNEKNYFKSIFKERRGDSDY